MSLNLRTKLLMQFLAVGLVPAAIIGISVEEISRYKMESTVIDDLSGLGGAKKKEIERYFSNIRDLMLTFSENAMVVDAAKNLKKDFKNYAAELKVSPTQIKEMRANLANYYSKDFTAEFAKQNEGAEAKALEQFSQLSDSSVVIQHNYIAANPNPLGSKLLLDAAKDSSNYSKYHSKFHPIVRSYLQKFGLYDVFLADPETGVIFYTVFKELDFATSLSTGPYSKTKFAEAFKKANAESKQGEFVLVDFEQYYPSYMAPASFIAAPIYDGNTKVAIAMFQMPIDRLNLVLNTREGLGATGETFLVGPDGQFRSDSYRDSQNRSVLASFRNAEKGSYKAAELEEVLAGKTVIGATKNYLGDSVISVAQPVDILGLKWAFFAQQASSEAFAAVTTLVWTILLIGLVSALLVALTAWYIGTSLSTPILRVAKELGDNSSEVSSASDSMATASNHLSELSNLQASSIEETAASLEEISAMVKNNVEQSEGSFALAKKVQGIAQEGNRSMTELVTSMDGIKASNKEIQELVKVIGEIGEKTKVIDEIVFQTKLLSFNASVEAERAGEHGRGFAVVAQEVGNLAQMSGKAALEIASMVKSSVRTAEQITSDNGAKVESGHKLVLDTANFLKGIAEDATLLAKQAEQISISSREQSEGVAQVNEAMAQLDQATQQNSATAEETAASSEELRAQADHLKNNIQLLLGMVNGSKKGSLADLAAIEARPAPVDRKPDGKNVVSIPTTKSSVAKKQEAPKTSYKKAVGGDFIATSDSESNWDKL